MISIGALAALTTGMLVSLLGQARILFSMARDGLLPAYLGRLDKHSREPAHAQQLTGSCCFFLAMFLDIEKLSGLVSMGTLFAFTIVNLSVLILRHRDFVDEARRRHGERAAGEKKQVQVQGEDGEPVERIVEPLEATGFAATYSSRAFWYHIVIFIIIALTTAFCFRADKIVLGSIFGSFAIIPMLFLNLYFWRQDKLRNENSERAKKDEPFAGDNHQVLLDQEHGDNPHQPHHHHHSAVAHKHTEYFKTPLCPTTPLLGMGINIFLICQTPAITWGFFAGWMGIAVLMYFAYGYSHSKEKDGHLQDAEKATYTNPELLSGDDVLSSSFSYDYSMDYNSSSEELGAM